MKIGLANKILLFQIVFTISIYSQDVITIVQQLPASGGVAVNVGGELFISDFGPTLQAGQGKYIFKIGKDGQVDTFATGLKGASGNAFDSKGNLFQANINSNTISKIKSDGTVTAFTSSNIKSPVGIAIDENDTVYVANCGGNSITKITPKGQSSIWVSSNLLNCPNGLAIDKDGTLYTCNFNNGNVIKITKNKVASVLVKLPTDRCGHLTFANDRLYVAGRCSNSIYEVLLNGKYKRIAGSGERGNKDGSALKSSFNNPNGIDASPDGDTLYINDCVSLKEDCLNVPLAPMSVRMITGVKSTLTNVKKSETIIPNNIILYQNYPNPFNPSTKISWKTTVAGKQTLKIFDVLGNEIVTLINELKPAGNYESDFTGNDLPSGIYFYQLKNGPIIKTRKMLLLK